MHILDFVLRSLDYRYTSEKKGICKISLLHFLIILCIILFMI